MCVTELAYPCSGLAGANVRLLRVVQSGDAIYITGQVVVKNIGYTKIVAAR